MFKRIRTKILIPGIFIYLFSTQSFSQVVTVSADKMNVFYIGVDNPVSIAAAGVPCEELTVSIINGKITGKNCRYTVTCDAVGTCKIIVSSKKASKNRHTWVSEFRVKMIPKPIFKIGPYGSCYTIVSKTVIQAQEYVRANLENIDFDARYKIDSFRLRIIRDSAEVAGFVNIGNKLNEQIRKAFSLLSKGDIIVFDKIITDSPLLSSSLKNFYESPGYDEYGNPVYKRSQGAVQGYLVLELDPLVLKVYE